jgi:hypothetical protein
MGRGARGAAERLDGRQAADERVALDHAETQSALSPTPDAEEDADKSNHIGMIRIGNEPMLRWSACPAEIRPQGIITTILAEADDPLIGPTSETGTAAATAK